MTFNKHLANRFVSDYKLPIPITSNETFFNYYLNLLEEDYGALTKWNNLIGVINERFNGDSEKFLNYYLEVRENIINTMHENSYYQEFNNMDMNKFAIKDKLNISSKNIYNCNNINKIFLSVDLKKANFQAVKYVNPSIVYDCETYDEFMSKFTDIDYLKESKYLRQVIWGQLNPSRHITVEKYMINQIRKLIDETYQLNSSKEEHPLVSMSNDELVYVNPIVSIPSLFKDKTSYDVATKELTNVIKNTLGFEVSVELFMLDGLELYSKNTLKVHKTVFNKFDLIKDSNKLVCVPLPFFPVIYKLFNDKELKEIDLYFDYEKMLAKIEENLGLHIMTKSDFDNSYINAIKSRLVCNQKSDDIDYTTFNYTEKDIEDNLDYFKRCYLSNMSANTSLELFYSHLKSKQNDY